MAIETVCDRCGNRVVQDPAMGDRQGGRVDLVFQAYTKSPVLCSACVTELHEWLPDTLPIAAYSGTARGMEAWQFIPRADTGKPPAEAGGKPLPPSFRA